MMQILNQSRFQAIALPAVCHEDNNHIVVIVKGTFDIRHADHEIVVSQQQADVNLVDVHWGEPGKSSLKYEADIAITKPGTDVVLVGKAWSTRGPVRQLDVSLRAGTMRKVVRVFGNRYWENSVSGWKMTSPEPFESMPLVYEYAYGGRDPWKEPDGQRDFDLRNPVGKGFAGKKSHHETDRIPLPNLELADQLVTDIRNRPEPAGFGFVARYWQPRSLLMGTYDQAWQEERNPLLPVDFDPASYSAASAGLCSDGFFTGGEQIVIDNVSMNGQVNFTLPQTMITVVSRIDEQRNEHTLSMDTVVIEPERSTLSVTWRVAIPCHWNLAKVEWLKIQERI